MTANAEVLNSWKEIAAYLGRGVRTVQRWEQELELPVHRPRGKSRSAVIAFKPELDLWLHHAPAERLEAAQQNPKLLQYSASERQAMLHETTELLIGKTRQLLSHSSNLCEQLKLLRAKVGETARITHLNVKRNAKHLSVIVPPLTGKRPNAPAPSGSYTQQASAS